jgi:pyridoxamine 5'-phosphate oxidase-like protein
VAFNRVEAAQAYVDAMRTGVHSLGKSAGKYLADDIVVKVGSQTVKGKQEAEARITGTWPNTPVLRKGNWQALREEGDKVKVHASMPPFGAGVQSVDLTFSFNNEGQISEVEQVNTNNVPFYDIDVMPDFVKARVTRALADDIPLSVAYVDEDGKPSISLRGSVMAYSDTQLAIWARNREGLAKAIQKNPNISLLYRENPTRSTLIFEGKARVLNDEKEALRIHDMSPEVEQKHLTRDTGAAIIIDIENVDGSTPEGRVRVRRKVS